MNRLTPPLIIICFGLAAYSTWSHLDRSRLVDRVAQLERDAENQATRSAAEHKKFRDEAAKLEKQTKELKAAAAPEEIAGTTKKPADNGKAVMEGMYQERTKFPFASNYVDQQNPDISRFTPENSERFSKEYTTLNDNIASRASGILTPPQLEVFRQSQTQQEEHDQDADGNGSEDVRG